MNRSFHIVHPSLVLAVALAGTSTASAQWTVTSLHPAGATSSSATGVHGLQQVGSAYFESEGATKAALWYGSAESFVSLALHARAQGVSNGRQVGSLQSSDFSNHAAVWNGPADNVIDLHPSGAFISEAYCISGSHAGGQVTWASALQHATLWDLDSPSSWIDLRPLDPPQAPSCVLGVSDTQQVGWFWPVPDAPVPHAALWSGTADSFVELHPTGAFNSLAYAVHGGQQVGRVEGHAALWTGTAETWLDLTPQGDWAAAYAVYDGIQAGQVGDHAALWFGSAASHVDLHSVLPSGFSDSEALGVWADATHIYVVGEGLHGSTREALLWTNVRCRSGVDLGGPGGISGADGHLDNNDLIVFIDYFFAADAHADRGSAGGVPGADGLFDNNDFVVYIAQFFAGC